MREKDDRPWKIPRPKGMAEYILRYCQAQPYVIFSTKLGWGACTQCGHEFSLSDMPMTHSKDGSLTVRCPECGCRAVPKDMRYGRKKLMDKGRIVWSRAYGRVTFVEVDKFIIDYQTPHPAVLLEPDEMIRLSADSQIRMDRDAGHWSGKPSWWKVKKIKLRQKPQRLWGRSEWHDHVMDYEIHTGTDLKYAEKDISRFDNGDWDEHRMANMTIRYMSDFLKYPAIELLEKSGFEKMVRDLADGIRSRRLNIQGRDLRGILKLNNGDIKKLRAMNAPVAFLEQVAMVREYLPGADIKDVGGLRDIMGWNMDGPRWKAVEPRVNFRKLMYRLLEEARETGDRIRLSDYCDYIEAIDFLGIRADKHVLYPRNFLEAHDEAIGAMTEIKEREKNAERDRLLKRFGETNKRTAGMEEPFTLGEYMIRPAEEPQELRIESRELSHCVRTYIDRVARGYTSILFIRKVESPEKPLFTLELSPSGHVVQCRGDHNCGYPEEVGTFIEEWQNWRTKMLKRRATA